jgi:hypothetical protein
MKLSASQAAKAVGKSVPTITRAIKSGKLTAGKLDGGGYEIEPSELFRVWEAVKSESDATPTVLGRETHIETSVLQAKLEVTEQRFEDAQRTIEDLRTRLDTESAERRQLTAQITDQRRQPEPQKRGFWARLVG